MMQVRETIRAGDTALWVVDGLPLAVVWLGGAGPLWLRTYPWPGDDEGVQEPLGTARYSSYVMADQAARLYIAGLPG